MGRYALLRRLGEGGMAEVWQAELQGPAGFRKPVALKFVHAQAHDELLIEEARLGALLRHPNVVQVYELDRADDGRWFIAMELVEGPTLAQLVRTAGALPPRALRDVARQVTAGLAHAHTLPHGGGLVHLDIKPQNLLVDREGVVKVADFGISRLSGSRPAGGGFGTPGYVAPESFEEEQPCDARADVFAVGVCLWFAAIGRTPLKTSAGVGAEMLAFTAQQRVRRSRRALHRVWPGLEEVVYRCLAPEPADRYPSARELRQALTALPRPQGADLLEVLDGQHAPTAVAATPGPTPARTASATPARLIGRDRELRAVAEALTPGAVVTVKGLGGLGKTRLARAAGERLEARGDTVGWASLSGASDELALLAAVGRALKVALEGTRDEVARQLDFAVASASGVLVLDGPDAASDALRPLLSGWRAHGSVAFLVTARSALGLDPETVLELGPLSEADGVALLRARAPHAVEDEALAARLVRMLDGIPLAIELAAARSALLSLRSLVERVERQRFRLLRDRASGAGLAEMLREAWSDLAPWDRAALLQLSVFQGSFPFDAAETVVDVSAWSEAPWPLDVIDGLWRRSLIRVRTSASGPVLSVYRTVGGFARTQLADTDAVRAAEEQHGRWMARLGSPEALVALRRPGARARLRALSRHLNDLLAASRSARARGDLSVAVDTALAVAALVELRGPHSLGLELLSELTQVPSLPRAGEVWLALGGLRSGVHVEGADEALERALACAQGDPNLRAAVQRRQAEGLLYAGDAAGAEERCRQALAAAEEGGDQAVRCDARRWLGVILRRQGRLKESAQACTEALEGYRLRGDVLGIGLALMSLANARSSQGDTPAAVRLTAQARAQFEAAGAVGLGLTAQVNHACYRMGSADREEVRVELEGALAEQRRRGLVGAVVHTHLILGNAAMASGDDARAAELYAAGAVLARQIGHFTDLGVLLNNLGDVYLQQRRWDEALEQLREAEGQAARGSSREWRILVRGNLGTALARTEGPAEGAAVLRQAIEDAEASGYRLLRAVFLAELSEVLCMEGRVGEAEPAARAAVEGLEQLHVPRELAKARAALARVAALSGGAVEAADLLSAVEARMGAHPSRELVARVEEVAALLADRATDGPAPPRRHTPNEP